MILRRLSQFIRKQDWFAVLQANDWAQEHEDRRQERAALESLFVEADGANRFHEVYRKHVIWDYNPEATTSDILLSTYNWESLRADESFIFEIIG